MIATIIIGVLVVISAVALTVGVRVGKDEDRDPAEGRAIRTVGIAAALIAAVLGFFSTFTIVKAAEVGVPITFGKIGDPMPSGVHFVKPWTKVESFPTRPFGVPDVKVVARTSQAGQVTAVVGARWHVVPERAGETYLQVRTGDEERISKEVVDKALGQAIGNVFASEDNLTATTNRTGVEAALLTELRRLTEPFGIAVDNVFLRSVEPDDKTADALARVAAQQRATEIAKESEQTAIAEAARRLAEAKGLRDAAAEIPTGLTSEQVAVLCAQAWERMATKAIEAGQSLYTSPCTSGATPVVGTR